MNSAPKKNLPPAAVQTETPERTRENPLSGWLGLLLGVLLVATGAFLFTRGLFLGVVLAPLGVFVLKGLFTLEPNQGAVLVFFGVALASIFVFIGLSVTNGEAAQAAAFPLLAPLTFASSAFVDPASMPGWLEWWARRQPLSKTTEAVRALMLGGPTSGPVTASIIWSVGIIAVMAPLAIAKYRRA